MRKVKDIYIDTNICIYIHISNVYDANMNMCMRTYTHTKRRRGREEEKTRMQVISTRVEAAFVMHTEAALVMDTGDSGIAEKGVNAVV